MYSFYAADFIFLIEFFNVIVEFRRLYVTGALYSSESTASTTSSEEVFGSWKAGLVWWLVLSLVNWISFNLVCIVAGFGSTPAAVLSHHAHGHDTGNYDSGHNTTWFHSGLWAMVQCVTRLYSVMRQSRNPVADTMGGSSSKNQTIMIKFLKVIVIMVICLHMICCSWIFVVNKGCDHYFFIYKYQPESDQLASAEERCWWWNNHNMNEVDPEDLWKVGQKEQGKPGK